MRLYDQLKRRGVLRVAATYLVVSWLILEVGHLLTIILELPPATMKIVLAALVLAFPLVLGLTWYFRFTADGLVREVDLPETDPAAPFEHEQHAKKGGHGHGGGDGVDPLPIIMGVLTMAALVLLVVIKFVAPDSLGSGGHGSPHGAARPAVAHNAPGEAVAAAPVHAAPSNSIAALPFDNLSGDPAQVYFSDGMAEELRGALAGVEGLQVAARTSSNAFRASNADVGTIAGKLGVAYVLDGSVRRAGPKVRISTQLIEAKSGFERWSQTYDREVRDVFQVQSDIAHTVTDALKVKLLPGEASRLQQGGTRSATALDAYLKGRQQFDLSGDEATYRAAVHLFDAAIAADPDYAAAYAARATALSALGTQFASTVADANALGAQALVSARRGVALQPGLAVAQSALAYVLQQSRIDMAGARAAHDRSLAAGGSGDADILIRYGIFNTLAGDTPKGIAALDKAVTLDRFNPRAWKSSGQMLYYTRRYDDALTRYREALRLSPNLGFAHQTIGYMRLMLGQLPAARAEFAAEPQSWARLTGLAIADWKLGNRAAADAALKQLVAENGDTVIYQVAEIHAQRGELDAAFAALDQAIKVRDPGLLYLRQDPLLDPLRADPRFKPLLERWTKG